MKITLENKKVIDLHRIKGFSMKNSLHFDWNEFKNKREFELIAFKLDGGKVTIGRWPESKKEHAFAVYLLINNMILNTTQN